MTSLLSKTNIFKTVKWCGLSLLAAVAVGCSSGDFPDTGDAQTESFLGESTDDASVQKALLSKLAVRVNLKTNRATLYKSGQAVGQWNIASADVSGEFHDQIPQSTPTGIFAAEDMQVCPEWMPRNPKDPKTGRLASNEQERMQIIKNNPDLFGPCGAKNPLGSYVIWFQGPYGIHGNSAEWVLEVADPEQRRVSGGCIRNPNEKIKELFHLVVDTFSELSGFKSSVLAIERASGKDKRTLTQSLSKSDVKVIVGRWSKDPQLTGGGMNPVPPPPPAPAPVVTPTPTPVPKKMKCVVSSVESVRGIVPVYSKQPAKWENEFTFYSRGDTATVSEEIEGTNLVRTEKGLVDKNYLSDCRIQN